jgi:germination protein M
MKWFRKLPVFVLAAALLLAGCGNRGEEDEGRQKKIYYLNNAGTGVEMHACEIEGSTVEEELDALITQLKTTPSKLEYKAPLQMGFSLLSYRLEDATLYLDVSEEYRNLSPTTEVLVRAALVRTLSQADGVKYVAMTVEGNQLYDSLGNIIGMMSADQFIDNAGDEINAYERVILKLYFANEDGTALIATNRTLAYNTNISLERLVVDELLSGPGAEVSDVVYPTINPNTKIVSISVKDGICYVNFDENFLTQIYNVSSEVAIYSIVNSLAELTNVNKVQISVNGETNLLYRESISLTTVFERNLDLVTTVE